AETIAQIYHFLSHSYPFLKPLVAKLESYFLKNISPEHNKAEWQKYISSVLQVDDQDSTAMQLGLMYYYLDRYNSIPDNGCLIDFRQSEMEKEIRELKATQLEHFASGVKAYLLRALCSMILDSHGKINYGGILAARTLLHAFCGYLTEEHLIHIEAVIM